MTRVRRILTYIALLSVFSFLWLFLTSEKHSLKGHFSFEVTVNTSTEHSNTGEFLSLMASRQEKRKLQLVSYCKKTKPVSTLQLRYLKHLIVDNKHKIVYCYIPKVACTTWKKTMAHLVGLNYINRSVHNLRFELLSFQSQSKARYILNNYYKFMFVREPFERLLSAYKDKFTRKSNDVSKKYGGKIKRSVRLRLGSNASHSDADIKFSDFILYLIDTSRKGGRLNEHWHHYDRLCYPCEINYDFIGHYETLEEDARLVLHEAGVDRLVSFPPVRYTATKDDLRRFYSGIPQEDVSELRRIYRRDFEMFGYTTALQFLYKLNSVNKNST